MSNSSKPSPSKGKPGGTPWGTEEEWAWLWDRVEVFRRYKDVDGDGLQNFWPWIETEFLKAFPTRTYEYLHPVSKRRSNTVVAPGKRARKAKPNNVSAQFDTSCSYNDSIVSV